MSILFDSFLLGDVRLKNRIVVAPMCLYSAKEGLATDWHFVHYASRAVGGAGMIIFEATAVSEEGRISADDLGLWRDEQIEPLLRINNFLTEQDCIPCVQLAHAGRKASAISPLKAQGRGTIGLENGGWQSIAPSAVAFSDNYQTPQAMSFLDIDRVVDDFESAARRALKAGFKAIEIHAAHGYLIHQFLSPLSNLRSEEYGGDLENRARLLLRIVFAIREVIPKGFPLIVRISATDWAQNGLTLEDSCKICQWLKESDVDLIDVSSAGLIPLVPVTGPGYQTKFAAQIRSEVQISCAAVGLITSPSQAEHILMTEQADLIILGREMLRDPYWALHAADTLGVKTTWPLQYLASRPRQQITR